MNTEEIVRRIRDIAYDLGVVNHHAAQEARRDLIDLADEIEEAKPLIYFMSEDVKHALEVNDEG